MGAADLYHLILPTGGNLFTAAPALCSLLWSLARIWYVVTCADQCKDILKHDWLLLQNTAAHTRFCPQELNWKLETQAGG